MQKQQPHIVVQLVGLAILALWGLSAVLRVAWVAPSTLGSAVWIGISLLLLAFIAWGVVRKIRTGSLPTREEERAVLSAVGGRVFSVIASGFGAACIASVIAVIELNDSFSREAVDRAIGEHPMLYWAIVGAGFFTGVGAYIWSIAMSERAKPSELENGAT